MKIEWKFRGFRCCITSEQVLPSVIEGAVTDGAIFKVKDDDTTSSNSSTDDVFVSRTKSQELLIPMGELEEA